jgi:hypothetical protein
MSNPTDPTDERKLATAIYETANQKLDPPPYIFSGLPSAEDKKLSASLGQDSPYILITPRGLRFHPLVVKYYKQWGDKYLQGLRATRRLLSDQ